MSDLDPIQSSTITTIDEVIDYTRQRYGVIVDWRQKAQFKSQWKQFHEDNPHVDVSILVKAVDWGKNTKRKVRTLTGVFYLVTWAFAAGALPELDPAYQNNEGLDQGVLEALEQESDPEWRRRLMVASGAAREHILDEWRKVRRPILAVA